MPSFSEITDDYLVKYLAYFNYKNYVERMNLQGTEKVFEIGCGGGNLSRFLAERLPRGKLVCIDNSSYWINKSKKRLKRSKNIRFESTDFFDFNKEDYFNIVVIHYVLHDISKERRRKFINQLGKILVQNGTIYIREPIRESHGMSFEEIRGLMFSEGFLEKKSKQGYSFPIRGKVFEGTFENS